MLNTLHLTIMDFYLRDFSNFPPVSLHCSFLGSWSSCASSFIFRTFSPFWPRVTAEEMFGQVHRTAMACNTIPYLDFNTCATTRKTPCTLIFVFTIHRHFVSGTFCCGVLFYVYSLVLGYAIYRCAHLQFSFILFV